jgi:hypothetical protein
MRGAMLENYFMPILRTGRALLAPPFDIFFGATRDKKRLAKVKHLFWLSSEGMNFSRHPPREFVSGT